MTKRSSDAGNQENTAETPILAPDGEASENARLAREVRRLLRENERQAAELAIINSVQEGLASKLDMQAIYDLVGDRIRDLFNAQSVWIQIFDGAARTRQFRYGFYQRRIHIPGTLPFNKLIEHLIATKKPLVIDRDAEAKRVEFEMVIVAGSEMFRSAVFVPLMAGGEVKGTITLQNMEQEDAFSESDVNLLSTLASSMSVALENARLFDETQRLLKETEQRNAELAIINSIQQGLAAELDFQAIVNLVGDKLCEVFNTGDLCIRWYDEKTNLLHFLYEYEHGERLTIEPMTPPKGSTFETILETRQPVVWSTPADYSGVHLPGTDKSKSLAAIPIISSDHVLGAINIENYEREHAFGESELRLLTTIAASLGTALENARLFDETQRLLKETEQSNAELAIINSVQAGLAEGLASKRDMQAIYDLVGDKIRVLFPNMDTEIRIHDPGTDLLHVPYYIEDGQRMAADPVPLAEARISAHVLRTGQTLVINENIFQEMEKYGATLMRGRRIPAKSVAFVPLLVGNQARGLIILSSVEREQAFSPSDVRLFQTLASSMSTALENARLFDETQRLFLEAEEARTAAERADQAKSAFLSSMSHELRTPLNAIINFVEMVARGMLGPVNREQVEVLDQALHSSRHLLNLINDVLDISKIQAGQLTLFIEEQVSVQVEVEAALSIAGGLLQEKGLHLVRDIDPHLPMVACDRRRVRQVLLNLISNAIKFTPAGTITVSVKDQGQAVLFAVIDTGPGIPPEEQDLIFEPFVQAENGERQVYGTGLGLPISRSLVRAHGGELWVDSAPGEGSAFYFTVPVERSPAP